ncbi:MAG: hypothetical protein ACLQVI_36405, partial [Polyangiaceae bacterium]
GLEGIERTSGVDVAGAILAHAERFVARRTKKKLGKDVVIEDERRVRRLRAEEESTTAPGAGVTRGGRGPRRGPATARHGS